MVKRCIRIAEAGVRFPLGPQNMKTDSDDLIRAAEKFATEAHKDQHLRNASADPYIEHPRKVAALVKESGGTAEEIAAAWLHDVVEDTNVKLDEIKKQFGSKIAEIVDGLTDPPHFAGNPSKIRKAWQAERVTTKSASVKRVKIADQIVNSYLMGFDPPIDYEADKRLDYVEGARLIALKCASVSQKLDELFEDTYQDAVQAIHTDMKKM